MNGDLKGKLLPLIEGAREQERARLVPHVDDSEPDRQGAWTARDQLAHLTAWRRIAVAELEAARTGGPEPAVADEDDVVNAGIYRKTRGLPAAVIEQEAEESWAELAAALLACADEDLARPRKRRPEQAYWQHIPNNTYFHLAEHLVYWYREQGDESGAEGAALWGHDLARATFPEDGARAVAAYNLGCFYAAGGRPAEALPRLREAFRLRPGLRDWARQDRDLDAIRSNPEVAEILS